MVTSWLWQKMQLGWACEKWPTAPGVVLETKMSRNEVATPRRRGDRWRQARGQQAIPHAGTKYDVLIRYEYTVDGKTYESTQITFAGLGLGFMEEPAARELLSRYSPDDEIDVHYNPDHPSEATLETGVAWWMYLVTGFIGLVTLFSAWTAWATFRTAGGVR